MATSGKPQMNMLRQDGNIQQPAQPHVAAGWKHPQPQHDKVSTNSSAGGWQHPANRQRTCCGRMATSSKPHNNMLRQDGNIHNRHMPKKSIKTMREDGTIRQPAGAPARTSATGAGPPKRGEAVLGSPGASGFGQGHCASSVGRNTADAGRRDGHVSTPVASTLLYARRGGRVSRCASISTEQNPNPEPPENLSDDDSDDNDGEAVAGAKVCLDDLLRSEHFSPKPPDLAKTKPRDREPHPRPDFHQQHHRCSQEMGGQNRPRKQQVLGHQLPPRQCFARRRRKSCSQHPPEAGQVEVEPHARPLHGGDRRRAARVREGSLAADPQIQGQCGEAGGLHLPTVRPRPQRRALTARQQCGARAGGQRSPSADQHFYFSLVSCCSLHRCSASTACKQGSHRLMPQHMCTLVVCRLSCHLVIRCSRKNTDEPAICFRKAHLVVLSVNSLS